MRPWIVCGCLTVLLSSAAMGARRDEDLGPSTLPSDNDREAVLAVDEAVKKYGKPETPAAEVAHITQHAWIKPVLRAIREDKPVRQKLLDNARSTIAALPQRLKAASEIAEPPVLMIPRAPGPIKIDGLSDDWKLPGEPTEIPFDRTTRAAIPHTAVQLAYDDDYLYGVYTVLDFSVVAPKLPRDGEIYNFDCVEIFLYDPGSRDYWELDFSPGGSLLDSFNTKDPKQWGGTLRPEKTMEGLQWAHAILPKLITGSDQGYTIEFAIPRRVLPHTDGQDLRLFLSRVDRDNEGNTTFLGHVPWDGWFHNVWCYQPIRFAPK